VTLQRLAIAVFLAFGLSACDAPQFQEPNTAGEMFSSAPEMPGPLTELRQAVSAIEKQDPNPAALEQAERCHEGILASVRDDRWLSRQ
jgi:hypothetical protein